MFVCTQPFHLRRGIEGIQWIEIRLLLIPRRVIHKFQNIFSWSIFWKKGTSGSSLNDNPRNVSLLLNGDPRRVQVPCRWRALICQSAESGTICGQVPLLLAEKSKVLYYSTVALEYLKQYSSNAILKKCNKKKLLKTGLKPSAGI